MANFSKFLNVNQDTLIEWIFDSNNYISENYNVLTNIDEKTKSFLSTQNLNKVQNTLFPVDKSINKYTKVDFEKFNFLQKQNYFTSNVPYNTIKINFPSTFDFEEEEYEGFFIEIYTYDFYDKNIVPFSRFFYDDKDPKRQFQLNLRDPFLFNGKEWSKYFEIKIPDLEYVANQRITDDDGTNRPIQNTINYELTEGKGLSLNSPIFIRFGFIKSSETTFGIKYYRLGDIFKISIPKVPEYQDLNAAIKESDQGDFFEIYGEWEGSNENLDDFVERLEFQGQKINIEYDVSLYEENILQRTQTFIINENFSQKIIYRPVITFSNTTAIIDVTMRIKNVINNTTITRKSSVGLMGNDLLKYGNKLSRIELSKSTKPKIYNIKLGSSGFLDKFSNTKLLKDSKNVSLRSNLSSSITNEQLQKVTFPVLTDRYQILVKSSNNSNNRNNNNYKPNGTLEIIITPYDNVIKFVIGKKVSGGNIEPQNLTDISKNSKLLLSFKSDSKSFDKNVYYESNDNDFKNGIVVFKIEESDLNIINKIYEKSKKFFITIYNEDTGTKQMLYSGNFVLYDDIQFTTFGSSSSTEEEDTEEDTEDSDTNLQDSNGEFGSDRDDVNLTEDTSEGNAVNNEAVKNRFNYIFTVEKNGNVDKILTEIKKILTNPNKQIYFTYFRTIVIIGINDSIKEEILNINGIDVNKSIKLPFNIGTGVAEDIVGDLNKIKSLVDEANEIFFEWFKSLPDNKYKEIGGIVQPVKEAKKELKEEVQDILDELKELGFKLIQNPDGDKLWMSSRDDGEPSYYFEDL